MVNFKSSVLRPGRERVGQPDGDRKQFPPHGDYDVPDGAPSGRQHPALAFTQTENPFVCNGQKRVFGKISGALAGESVTFSSPQATLP